MNFSLNSVIIKEMFLRKGKLISGLLAITLGIAVIVGIQSITTVSEQAVAKKLDLLGANIQVLPQGASSDNYYSADIDAPTFPEEYVERIVTSMIPGVDNLSPKLSRRIKIDGQSVVLTGILPRNELASKPIWQASGLMGAELELSCAPSESKETSLTDEDLKAQRTGIDSLGSADIWAGSQVAKKLKLKKGDSLAIEGKEFTVSHVLSETGTIDDDRLFAHLHTVQALLGVGSQISNIEIMGCCSAISDGLLGKLRNILPDTRITTITHIVNTQIETNNLLSQISIILLIIIVIVGAISIGNFMWANVEARRKEIGTLITLGISNINIYRLFFIKAVILGLIGGVIGYIIGTTAAVILGPRLADLNVTPFPEYILWSTILAIFIAIVGSWFPIHRATKLDPAIIMQEV